MWPLNIVDIIVKIPPTPALQVICNSCHLGTFSMIASCLDACLLCGATSIWYRDQWFTVMPLHVVMTLHMSWIHYDVMPSCPDRPTDHVSLYSWLHHREKAKLGQVDFTVDLLIEFVQERIQAENAKLENGEGGSGEATSRPLPGPPRTHQATTGEGAWRGDKGENRWERD